jgi:hypothetical protein
MSVSRINNKRTFTRFTETEERKFCGVCKNAGKSEKEYTSHFIKSVAGPKGIIVCPTILSAECQFCFQRGHWANEEYCPALKEKKRNEKFAESQSNANTNIHVKPAKTYASVSSTPIQQKINNVFEVFNQVPVPTAPVADMWPALPSCVKPIAQTKTTNTMSYATMAAKEAPLPKEKETPFVLENLKLTKRKFSKSKPTARLFEHAVNEGRFGNINMLDTQNYRKSEDEYSEESQFDYDNDDNYYTEERVDSWD